MRNQLVLYQEKLIDKTKQLALVELAVQVAHDIRSPLTALKVLAVHVEELPENKRIMIRNAVQRIEDIANDLAERQKKPYITSHVEEDEKMSIHLLSSLIEPLISEKRIQYRARLGVHIRSMIDVSSYGLFAQVQSVELKRVLSNLINNAVEALPAQGSVTVDLTPDAADVVVRVRDSGTGIAPAVLPQLTARGATFDKAGGSGLGLHHARSTMESWGGTLAIDSTVGEGTMITLRLPRADPPSWFVPALTITPGSTVVIIDDDTSIHQVWDGRLATIPLEQHDIAVQHFSSGTAVSAWYQGDRTVLFLCDYELLGEPANGLDLIDQLHVREHAILVTSRYEEQPVRARCAAMGVRLIPKDLAGFVPIEIMDTDPPALVAHAAQLADPSVVALPQDDTARVPQNDGMKPKVLVLDDDAGIRMAWALEQERLGVGELRSFASMEACEAAQPDYAQYDFAFVDKNIPESTWRIDQVIRHLKSNGVKQVVVASGENPEAVKKDVLCQDADGFAATKIPETLDR